MGDVWDIAKQVMTFGMAGVMINQAEMARDQKNAQNDAKAAAEKQATASEQAMNAANKKKPDITSILAAAQQASRGGGNSTMLTGPQGAAPSTLGSSSLLGS